MAKLYVSSAIQAALMNHVYINEIQNGFWKNHRPANHSNAWTGVVAEVSTDGNLGADGFEVPRTYNLLNPDFIKANEVLLVSTAQDVKPGATIANIKKELEELSRIIGGRLTSRNSAPITLYRGNHKPGTAAVSKAGTITTAAREASDDLADAAAAPIKKTVVKQKVVPQVEAPVNVDVSGE